MQCIGDGNADGETVQEKVVHALISPPYLKDISWTGKGKPKEKKVPLSKFENLVSFMKSITLKADKHYTEADFNHKMIYGILKRAPTKYGGKNDDKENVLESSALSAMASTNDIAESTLKTVSTEQSVKSSAPLAMASTNYIAESTLNTMSTEQSAPMSHHHHQNYPQPNYHPPIAQSTNIQQPHGQSTNLQPPHQHYPPQQQQHHHQNHPYHYNYSGSYGVPWYTGVTPTVEHDGLPPHDGPPLHDGPPPHDATYFQL